MPLTIDLPPHVLAVLTAEAVRNGRTPAAEAAERLMAGLTCSAADGAVDWTGDPLTEAFLAKVKALREDPAAFDGDRPDPFDARVGRTARGWVVRP